VKPLVIVSSVIANKPFNGGNARMVLNWLDGLEQLGADVFFIEQIRSDTCVDHAGVRAAASDSVNRAYFDDVLRGSRRQQRAALVCDAGETLDGATIHGATAAELYDLASDADLLINISGHLATEALKSRIRRRAYVDLDPGYTQLWHVEGSGAARLDGHDMYFTVGEGIGTPACTIPTGGIDWRPIRQPIVLTGCRVGPSAARLDRFTTVASWRGAYAPMTYNGTRLGSKAHEFRPIVDLPRLTGRSFEIALDIDPGDTRDRNALLAAGWHVLTPRSVAATPEAYCDYIEGSAAECTAAQAMYVHTRSGWFSDRTARYLASGKPVLVQDTGSSVARRAGEGLLTFDDIASAIDGVERISRDYRCHSEAARSVAERYFDSDTQLGRLMEHAGLA
jgi:hypothetical protein